MERSLGLRIAFVIVGLSALVFGIFTGFSHGWELDIVNTITIVAGIVLTLSGIFFRGPKRESKSVQSHQL